MLQYNVEIFITCNVFLDSLPTVQQVAKVFLNSFVRPSVYQPKRQINNAFRDLLLILDSSGSIGSERYTNAKGSLSEMLGLMCPTPDPFGKDLNRVALLTYSTTVTESFDFKADSSCYDISRLSDRRNMYKSSF